MTSSHAKIAVDAMGGDFAPRSVVEGALAAAAEGISVVLVGDRQQIQREIKRRGASPDDLEIEALADAPKLRVEVRKSSGTAV